MTRIVPANRSRLRLSAKGRWYHQGEPFENTNIISFFHRAIRRDPAGRYYLHNVVDGREEHVYFEVEDTALFVLRVEFDERRGEFVVDLNTAARETLDLRTLEEDGQGVLYCRLSGGERARFVGPALSQLAEHAREDEDGIYIERAGRKIYVSRSGSG